VSAAGAVCRALPYRSVDGLDPDLTPAGRQADGGAPQSRVPRQLSIKTDGDAAGPMYNIPERNCLPLAVGGSVAVHTVNIIQLIDFADGAGKDRPIPLVDGMDGGASGNIVMHVRVALRFIARQLRI